MAKYGKENLMGVRSLWLQVHTAEMPHGDSLMGRRFMP